MRDFFHGIGDLFVNYLFWPLDFLRNLELDNWWLANIFSWILILIAMAAFVYWMLELKKFDDNNEEDETISSHSYL